MRAQHIPELQDNLRKHQIVVPEAIRRVIRGGANAVTFTPPATGEFFGS